MQRSSGMPKVLLVEIHNYFGRVVIEPINDEARLFAELLGQTTLTEKNIELIKKLGFEVKSPEVKL